MASPNFQSILDTPAESIEKPKPLPQGSYLCVVRGLPRLDKSTKKQTPFIEFTLQLSHAGEDVDQEELAAMGGVANKTLKATFYYKEEEPDSLWRVKDFLEHCGIAQEGSIRAMFDNTPNCEVVAYVKHEPSNDGTSVFAVVGKTAPTEGFVAA